MSKQNKKQSHAIDLNITMRVVVKARSEEEARSLLTAAIDRQEVVFMVYSFEDDFPMSHRKSGTRSIDNMEYVGIEKPKKK